MLFEVEDPPGPWAMHVKALSPLPMELVSKNCPISLNFETVVVLPSGVTTSMGNCKAPDAAVCLILKGTVTGVPAKVTLDRV